MKTLLLPLSLILVFSTLVLSQPVITSFTPTSGPVGTSVTISGTGFSSTPANNIVYFGATRATVTAATATQLTVTVPIGATYQPFTVLVNGLTAYSKSIFRVTYTGWERATPQDYGYSFLKGAQFITGEGPNSIAIGDLDGDGKSDLVVANKGNRINNTLSIFRNTSNSGLVAYDVKIDLPTGYSTSPEFVSIADLDGDGKLDLVVAMADNYRIKRAISVFRNIGTIGRINFAPQVDFVTPYDPSYVAIADLDLDGRVDLAILHSQRSSVSVLRNNGTIGNINFDAMKDFYVGLGPSSIAISDLDGDQKLDLAVTCYSENLVSVLRNTGTVGTISFEDKLSFYVGTNPSSVAIGDLDGDSKGDLAVGDWTNHMTILKNTGVLGRINFTPGVRLFLDWGVGSSSVVIGNLDGTGLADIAVTDSRWGVFLLYNKGSNGKIDFQIGSLFLGPLTKPMSLTLGDLDGDGKDDLATTSSGFYWMTIFKHTKAPERVILNNTVPRICVNSTFELIATTNSGLPVTYSMVDYGSNSGVTIARLAGNVITGLKPGDVTISAQTMGNNEYAPSSVLISATILSLPSAPSITASGVTAICQGGSVGLKSSAGSSYLWSTGATTQSITVGAAGNYTVRVTDANGCMSAASAATIVTLAPGPIDGTIAASSNSICLGQSVTISSRDGAGEPYYWASTNGGSSWDVFQGAYAGQSSFPFTPTQAGTYRFHLRNRTSCGFCWDSGNNGCPTFPFVDVVVNAIPYVYIAGDGATFCSGSSTSLTAVSSAPYFSWSTGASGTQLSTVNVFSAGTYSVTAYQNGCSSTAQATVYEQYCNPDPPCIYGYYVVNGYYVACPCFDTFCARTEAPGGSEPSDDPNVSELSVFPNPAIAQVTVALPARVEVDTPVRFFDLLGRQQGNVNIAKGQWKVSVSLDQAAEGTYIIKVGQSGKSTKLIVKR